MHFVSDAPQTVTVYVLDALGRHLATQQIGLNAGTTSVRLTNSAALPRGQYWLQFKTPALVQTISFEQS